MMWRFLAELPWYMVYAACGTMAATLAKASLARWHGGDRREALVRFAAGCLSLLGAFALLVVLLEKSDLSVMSPVGIGLNILYAAISAVLVFRERLSVRRVAGLAVIVVGVTLIGLGAQK